MSKPTVQIFKPTDYLQAAFNCAIPVGGAAVFVSQNLVSIPALIIAGSVVLGAQGTVLASNGLRNSKHFGWVHQGLSLATNSLTEKFAQTSKTICSFFSGAEKASKAIKLNHIFPDLHGAASLMAKGSLNVFGKHTIDATRENLEIYDGNGNLPEINQTISKSMGLKKAPILKIFHSRDTDEELGAFAFLKHVPNAMVYKSGDGSECMLTKRLLGILTDNEESTVVGHEIGHVAGKHVWQKVGFGLPTAAASLATTATSSWALLTSSEGLTSFASAIGSSMIVSKVTNPLIEKDIITPKTKDLTQRFVSFGVILTMPAALGRPDIGLMFAASKTADFVSKLVSNSISRTNELHADRLSADATQMPEELASALNKISNDPSIPFVEPQPTNGGGKFIRGIKELFKTHPTVERRMAALYKHPASNTIDL